MTGSKLDKYISEHTSAQSPVLEDLYRETHLKFINPNMVSGHVQGKLLEFLSAMLRPTMILEIGTFTGYSAICLARGLKPGGKLITIEINDELLEFSKSYFIKAGLDLMIIQLVGRAQDLVPGLDYEFDLAYIDGDKREYIDYYNKVFPKIKQGGFIIVDNVLWGGKVLENIRPDPMTRGIIDFNEMIREQQCIEKIILPVRDGIMLIRKM
jgi:predicted O-methyltransferase YrrM